MTWEQRENSREFRTRESVKLQLLRHRVAIAERALTFYTILAVVGWGLLVSVLLTWVVAP